MTGIPSADASPRPPASGTVYTPERLADALVRALRPRAGQAWLDPCVGDGAFLRALRKHSSALITALDLETRGSVSDFLADRLLRGRDFLAWAGETDERFDRIVANPPYVSLSQVSEALRETALSVQAPDGTPIRLGANYWAAFLCASLRLLKPGGSLGFILPAAWDYADYAEPLRRKMARWFSQVEVHRCLKPMFSTVSDGCVVLIARGYGSKGRWRRREYRTLDELVTSLSSIAAGRRLQVIRASDRGIALGQVLEIRLGGVTGDSHYFLLTEEERKARKLPEEAFVPVLSKAQHLEGGQITLRDWEQLKVRGHRVWLFRPESKLETKEAVRSYLELPEGQGGCRRGRFKIRIRTPWYQTPMPTQVHGFITGMSRRGVWVCLNRMRNLNATNTLYVVKFLRARGLPERAAYALSLLTSPVREALRAVGRRYPDGLYKFEPGDIAKIRIPQPTFVDGAFATYLAATSLLISGEANKASQLADEWFTQSRPR